MVNPKVYKRVSNQTLNEYLEKREANYAKLKEEGSKKIIKDKFNPGNKVFIQNPKTKHWDHPAVIVKQRYKKSFILDDNGNRIIRNRKQLILAPVLDDPEAEQETEIEVQPQQNTQEYQNIRSQRPTRKRNKPKRLIESS